MCVLAHLGAKMFKSQLGLLNCVFKKGILLQVPFSTLNFKKNCIVNRKVIVLFHLLTSVIWEEWQREVSLFLGLNMSMPIPTIWEHANSQRKTLDVIKKTSHWAVDSFTHYPDRTFVSNFRRLHEGISVACITQDHPFSTSLYKEHLDTWEYLTMRFRTKGIICFSASYYLVSNKDSICSRIYWGCILTKATIRVSVFCCESLISFSLSLDKMLS